MIRYLLDELHSYEEDHSDALCPVQREAQGSLMGEHVLARPVSTQEVRLMHTAVFSNVQGIHDEMGTVKATVDQMASTMKAFVNMHFSEPSGASSMAHLIFVKFSDLYSQYSHLHLFSASFLLNRDLIPVW